MDCDFIRAVLFGTQQSFTWGKSGTYVTRPGGCSLRCLTPRLFSFFAGIVVCISSVETSRSSDRRLTGDSGRESDTSDGGGVNGYSISEVSSSE